MKKMLSSSIRKSMLFCFLISASAVQSGDIDIDLYTLYSEISTEIRDRNTVSGCAGSNTYCEMGVNASLTQGSSIVSAGDILLRNNAYVDGNAVAGGSFMLRQVLM